VGFDKPQLGNRGYLWLHHQSFWSHWIYRNDGLGRPKTEIVFIFFIELISDSVNKLSKENIREDIQGIIYDSIEDYIFSNT
jgi:hypothetical protein